MVKQGPTKNDPDIRKYFPTSGGKLSIFIFEDQVTMLFLPGASGQINTGKKRRAQKLVLPG
jgi:hypothetical protein